MTANFGMAGLPDCTPPPPMVQVVQPYIVVRAPKSVGVAILLTLLFGPLGMLYSTVPGALIMLVARWRALRAALTS